MDTLIGMVDQLGLDQSIIFQFFLALTLFFLAKVLFANKLQSVIENRERKTVIREKEAEEVFNKANKLAENYNQSIDVAKKEAQKNFNEKRSEVVKAFGADITKAENEIEDFINKARADNEKEVSRKKQEIFANASELTDFLVNTIETRQ